MRDFFNKPVYSKHSQFANLPVDLRMIILNFMFHQEFQDLAMELLIHETILQKDEFTSQISENIGEFLYGKLVEPRSTFQVLHKQSSALASENIAICADIGESKLYAVAINVGNEPQSVPLTDSWFIFDVPTKVFIHKNHLMESQKCTCGKCSDSS